jgi:hypothetical protein
MQASSRIKTNSTPRTGGKHREAPHGGSQGPLGRALGQLTGRARGAFQGLPVQGPSTALATIGFSIQLGALPLNGLALGPALMRAKRGLKGGLRAVYWYRGQLMGNLKGGPRGG